MHHAGRHLPARCTVPGPAALGAAIALALLACTQAHAAPAAPADAQFDMTLLAGGSQQPVDLSRFERGNVVMPGHYRLDLYLDGEWTGVAEVRFANQDIGADVGAVPCFTSDLLERLGLPQAKLTEQARALLAQSDACIAIDDLIPDATATYDQAELRLDVTVPQAWKGYRARGYVSPDQWDKGATAALLNYNLNTYRNDRLGDLTRKMYKGDATQAERQEFYRLGGTNRRLREEARRENLTLRQRQERQLPRILRGQAPASE